MKSEYSTYNTTVKLLVLSSIVEIGRVAARGFSLIKNEPGKKYDYELLRGYKFIIFESALIYKYNLLSY
jgi:hypothetical protein